MGQIANQMVLELFSKIKKKVKERGEKKKQKEENIKKENQKIEGM